MEVLANPQMLPLLLALAGPAMHIQVRLACLTFLSFLSHFPLISLISLASLAHFPLISLASLSHLASLISLASLSFSLAFAYPGGGGADRGPFPPSFFCDFQ